MKKEIKTVVFDFDGVLVDSVELKENAMKETFLEFGKDFAEEVLSYHKEFYTTRYTTAEYVQRTLNIEDEGFVKKYAKKYSDLVEEQIVKMPFYTGAESLLISLSKNMPIYISTGTPKEEIERILTRKCCKHLFNGVYGSPDKKEDHFKKILEETGLDSEEILFIGDMPSDYHTSQIIGVNFLGYNFRYNSFCRSVRSISSLMEILDFIEKRKPRGY